MILGFYLPGMKAGEGAWANAEYDPEVSGPELKINIFGQHAKAAAEELQSLKLNPGETLIGRWVDSATGLIVIFKKNGRLYRQFGPDPHVALVRDVLQVSDAAGGKKLKVTGSDTGDYYVISPDGSLEEGDREGFIRTAEKSQK
jgi:hypothetical protein